jgi:ATP-dependent DNA helicase DinG
MDVMQQAIEETGGREVFFAGTVGPKGLVEEVRVCARGNEGAVPALSAAVKTGEVVIHNHPSGDVSPSDADLRLATLFSHLGNGVFIVDNALSRVYVVVEPFLSTEKQKLDPTQLLRVFEPGGRLSKAVPQFEARPQQAAMMEAVTRCLNDDQAAVIEAPTGVGKTFAYLLPAIQWALKNRERIVIATKTINLQEQLIQRDIPVLARCLREKFTAVLVKGRHNYLCRRKLERALSEAQLFDDEGQRRELNAIAEWAEKTEDGSLSDLPFVPARETWERLCSESDTCSFAHCPNPAKCFIGRARREVSKADIIVANHHMLFSDLALKKEAGSFTALGVLPAYQRVVFDEAHNIEDSATEYFGAEASRGGAMGLLNQFVRSERGHERGLLPYLKLKLMRENIPASREIMDGLFDLIDEEVLPALTACRESLLALFDVLRAYVAERCGQVGRDIKWRLTEDILADPELRRIHAEQVLPAVEVLYSAVRLCVTLYERLCALPPPDDGRESPIASEILQLNAFCNRLARMGAVLAEGTSPELAPNTVRWIEIDAKNDRFFRIARCPLEVGEALSEWLFGNLKSVVMTSATLSVGRSFDYLHNRLGLDRVIDRHIENHLLDSPFDFRKQALFAIPTDIALPDDKGFLDEVVKHVRAAVRITGGHAFVLFTSFYALDYVHRRLDEEFRALGIRPMKQGEATRTRLLDEFRSAPSSVLFATDSFWEGVDVAGEALQCVIVPKLPFRVPTEPIQEARAEAISEAGGDSFMDYSVPQAVIKFRQGLGRLIRRKTDRGAVLVLDRRIVTKRYGRVFLDSLPEMRMVQGPSRGVYAALDKFFKQESEMNNE